MTNEEKAAEIRDKLGIYADAYYGALDMAEWKDEQLKIYLKEKWKAFDDDKGYLDEGIRRSLIEEIYRELFNETIDEL